MFFFNIHLFHFNFLQKFFVLVVQTLLQLGQLPVLPSHAVVDDGDDGPLHELDGGNLGTILDTTFNKSTPTKNKNTIKYDLLLKTLTNEKMTSSKFHQHFKSTFSANFFAPKKCKGRHQKQKVAHTVKLGTGQFCSLLPGFVITGSICVLE
jgi:hypothetical protein